MRRERAGFSTARSDIYISRANLKSTRLLRLSKWAHQGVLSLHFDFYLLLLHWLTVSAQMIWQIIFEKKISKLHGFYSFLLLFLQFAASLMGPRGAPNLFFCFPSLDDSYLKQNNPSLGHLRRTNNKILIILAIFSYFCHLGALKGPLRGP